MTRHPVFLVALAVVAALATVALFLFVAPSDDPTATRALEPGPGEGLRLRPAPPAPVLADPAVIARGLEGAVLLPGDRPLAEALQGALAAGEQPSYMMTVDVPLSDNAALAVRDEVQGWVGRKMAGMGFRQSSGRPSVNWTLHVDPAGEGRYTVQVRLRSGGETRFERAFVLPAEYRADRVDQSLATAFAPAGPEPRR